MRQEVVRGQKVGDDGPRLGKRQHVTTSAVTFALDEREHDRREDDVAMPPVKGLAFEMIEAELVGTRRVVSVLAARTSRRSVQSPRVGSVRVADASPPYIHEDHRAGGSRSRWRRARTPIFLAARGAGTLLDYWEGPAARPYAKSLPRRGHLALQLLERVLDEVGVRDGRAGLLRVLVVAQVWVAFPSAASDLRKGTRTA